jgi:hypothetical protein
MDAGWLVLFEGILVFGLLLGFVVWQLHSLKKMEREDKAKADGRTGESAFTRPRGSEGAAGGSDSAPDSAADAGHSER